MIVLKISRGETSMIMRSQATIISNGKSKEFFQKLNEKCPDKSFWDDCKKIRSNVNEKSMKELNDLIF